MTTETAVSSPVRAGAPISSVAGRGSLTVGGPMARNSILGSKNHDVAVPHGAGELGDLAVVELEALPDPRLRGGDPCREAANDPNSPVAVPQAIQCIDRKSTRSELQ